jgi:probable HAF family extracellular repeat protein
MNTKLKRVAIFLAAISTASISAMAHADWSIMGLGSLGGKYSYAYDINDSGQVAGATYVASNSSHAFITGPNGIGMTDLGTLGGLSSAISINDSGQVAGIIDTEHGHFYSFITGSNGVGMTALGTLGGNYTLAQGINNSGQVVGYSDIAGSTAQHAYITGPNGIGITDLGTLGGDYSYASDINNSGQVVGSSSTKSGSTHAFITGPNGIGMIDLGTLGGDMSSASGINDSGQVVGYSYIASGFAYHAFITNSNGVGMMDLGTLGGNNSRVYGLNDSGEAVGEAATATGESHSFIFSHGGMTDLSLLVPVVTAGWTNLITFSINNTGQMAGYGHHNGNLEAFLLSYTPDTVFDPKPIYIPPVPEPETYLMLLSGLGLIRYLARRREETAI